MCCTRQRRAEGWRRALRCRRARCSRAIALAAALAAAGGAAVHVVPLLGCPCGTTTLRLPEAGVSVLPDNHNFPTCFPKNYGK